MECISRNVSWGSFFSYFVVDERRSWDGRWNYFYAYGNLSWILEQSEVDCFDVAACGGNCLCTNDIKEKRKERQNAYDTNCVCGICHFVVMKTCKGSFTIEASFIVPLVLFLMAIAMDTAIILFEETKAQALEYIDEEQIDIVSTLYHIENLETIFSKWTDD